MPPRQPNHDPFLTGIPVSTIPETGPVDQMQLEAETRRLLHAMPPRPGEPGYDPATAEAGNEAYGNTRRYLVDAMARRAAEDPQHYTDLVGDLRANRDHAQRMASNDPAKGEVDELVRMEAEALAPVPEPSVGYDERARTQEDAQRIVHDIINRVVNATREHRSKGYDAMREGVAQLQSLGEAGYGEMVRLAMLSVSERMGESVDAMVENTEAFETTVVEADQVTLQARRKAAALGDPDDARPSAATRTGRAISKFLQGGANASTVDALHAERETDAQKAAAKLHASRQADADATASVRGRSAGLARHNLVQHGVATGREKMAAEAVGSMYHMLFKTGSTGDTYMVLEHSFDHLPPDAAPIADRIREYVHAPVVRSTNIENAPADVFEALRQRANHNAIRMRTNVRDAALYNNDGGAALFAEVDTLYRHIEAIDDQLEALPNGPLSSPLEDIMRSTHYMALASERIATQRAYNQAIQLYGQKLVDSTPLAGRERDFGGRMPVTVLEDGGILMGNDEYRTIHWSNGDYAFVLRPGEQSQRGAFEGTSRRADGTVVSHGNFLRVDAEDNVQINPESPDITSERAREISQERVDYRRTHDFRDPTDIRHMRDRYNDGRAHFAFSNNDDPENAESLITAAEPYLHAQIVAMEDIRSRPDQALYTYLRAPLHRDQLNRQLAEANASGNADRIREAGERITNFNDFATVFESNLRSSFAITEAQTQVQQAHAARLNIMRAASYDGRTRLLHDGSVLLPANEVASSIDGPSLHAMLGLPEGAWRISPDGTALHMQRQGKQIIRTVYAPGVPVVA